MSGKYRDVVLLVVLFFVPGVIAKAQTRINFSNPITYPAGQVRARWSEVILTAMES
jgi:hypothetical protein